MSAVADSLTQGDLARRARVFNVWLTGSARNGGDGIADRKRMFADISDDENAPADCAIMVIAKLVRWSTRW